MSYEFDPRLAHASTIPSSWYFDPQILERELDTVFTKSWQLAGHVDRLESPGSYFTTTLGREPVLVVRGRDGLVRAMSNVCRHRAGPVARGEGKRASFQCGYHGWGWSLQGELLTTPEFDGVEGFSREDVCLPQFRTAVWNGLVFVSLDPSGPELVEVMSGVDEWIGTRDFGSLRRARRKEWTIDCNWKVYVDNYLEGYHIPIVHPALFRELDYDAYATETRRWSSIQHSPIREATRLRRGIPGDDDIRYFWVFPNLMLNVYPDNYSTNLIIPLGPDKTLTIFEWFFRDPESEATQQLLDETISFSDEIQIEDIEICETVQRNLRSNSYSSGRYSVRRENGVHHFHGLLAEFLAQKDAK